MLDSPQAQDRTVQQSPSHSGLSSGLSASKDRLAVMVKEERQGSLLEELFEQFPRGMAVLELADPNEVSTWRLAWINDLASSIVVPSIESFLSGAQLKLSGPENLPNIYREIIASHRARRLGMVEAHRGRKAGLGALLASQNRLYTVLAFPAGPRQIGIFFEDAHSFVTGRSARLEAERQLAQTCEFLGAIQWKAEPETLRFNYVSPHAQAILGYWLERWTGETNFWKKHIFPDDRERVAAMCEKIFRERRRRDFEFRMISVHGQILWFHAAAEIWDGYGHAPELVGVMNNITDLKRTEERVRALSSRLIRVQDDERRHVSRELHDSLGQYLTSIKINVDLVKRESRSIEARHLAMLIESSETLEKCVREVRTVSYLLHPPLLDELGLVAAVRWFVGGFSERSGININLNVPAEFSRLAGEMELALFRIVQESLTNVQRHSGSDTAWVMLAEHNDRIELRISDQGVGVPGGVVEQIKEGKAIEGIGLRGMYERVRDLGGQLELESSALGTAVSVVLPLRKHERTKETPGQSDGKPRRVLGEPMETSDVQIEQVVTDGNDQAGRKREFRAPAAREGRRASRRLT